MIWLIVRGKGTKYLAWWFLQPMKTIDHNNCKFDVILFGGASNVQKRAKILSKQFPWCTIMQDVRHIVSIVFQDNINIDIFNFITDFNHKLINYFYSTHHSSTVIFTSAVCNTTRACALLMKPVMMVMMGHYCCLW